MAVVVISFVTNAVVNVLLQAIYCGGHSIRQDNLL